MNRYTYQLQMYRYIVRPSDILCFKLSSNERYIRIVHNISIYLYSYNLYGSVIRSEAEKP